MARVAFKKAGSYANMVAVFAKKTGAYSVLVGAFAKASAVYANMIGVVLPTPFLIEGFENAPTGWTPATNVTITSDTTWHPQGNASMDVLGAATAATATATKTLPGTQDPTTWGTVAIYVNVKNSAMMSQLSVTGLKGATTGSLSLSGFSNNGAVNPPLLRDGPRWIALDVATNWPAIYALGATTGIQLRVGQGQASTGGTEASWDMFVGGARGFPKVMFSFDDQYIDQYTIAYPAMAASGIRGNLFICRDFVGLNGTRMTEANVNELYAAGWGMPLDSTTDDTATNIADPTAALANLNLNKAYLLSKGWTGSEAAFCWTFGTWNEATCVAFENGGYKLGRTTQPGTMFTRFGPNGSWMTFFGYGIGGKTAAQIKAVIDQCIADGTTVLFYGHHVLPGGTGADIDSVALADACAYLKTKMDAGLCANPNMAEFLATDGVATIPVL